MTSVVSLKKGLRFMVSLMARKTTVYLERRHYEWLERNAVNFSRWIRDKVDTEIMKEEEVVKRFVVEAWFARKREIPEEIEGVVTQSRKKAIFVDPVDELFEGLWIPKSVLEKVELVGPYKEKVNYPRRCVS